METAGKVVIVLFAISLGLSFYLGISKNKIDAHEKKKIEFVQAEVAMMSSIAFAVVATLSTNSLIWWVTCIASLLTASLIFHRYIFLTTPSNDDDDDDSDDDDSGGHIEDPHSNKNKIIVPEPTH